LREVVLCLRKCLPTSPSPTLPLWFQLPPAGKVDAFNQRSSRVFVAASLECFPDLSPQEGLEALADWNTAPLSFRFTNRAVG
jgi:hypothetical protein